MDGIKRKKRSSNIKMITSKFGYKCRYEVLLFVSGKNIYAQIIDDVAGNTLVSCSTLDKEIKTKHANKEAAKEVGALIAKKATEKKITEVVFDRGGYIYHGVVKELAEAARENVLKF